MSDQITISKTALVDLVLWASSLNQKWHGEGIPEILQQAINESASIEELLDLYFTTDFTIDEAAAAAFQTRFNFFETQL